MIASTIIASLVAGYLTFAPMPQHGAATRIVAPQNSAAFKAPPLNDAFTSKPGRFSIEIPDGYSEPELETNDVDSEIGDIKLYMYTSVNMAEGVCLVGYSDIKSITMTDELKAEMLQGAKEGALSNMGATLQSEEDISIDGHPGHSIRFTTENAGTEMRGRMDYYMVDNRLYQVGFIEIANGSLDGDGVRNYFSSFKLNAAGGKGKKKK